MSVFTSEGRTTWLLGATSVALALLLAYRASVDLHPIPSGLPASADHAHIPPVRPAMFGSELGALEQYGAVIERPLFNATRRPPPPPAESLPVEAGAAQSPPRLTLVGVVLAPDQRSAIFRNITTSKVMRVREGAPLGDWTLEALETDRVVLRHRDSAHEITLRHFDTGSPVGAGIRSRAKRQRSPPG